MGYADSSPPRDSQSLIPKRQVKNQITNSLGKPEVSKELHKAELLVCGETVGIN